MRVTFAALREIHGSVRSTDRMELSWSRDARAHHAVIICARTLLSSMRVSGARDEQNARRLSAGGARISARRRLHRPWLHLPHSVVGADAFRPGG
jgi:hypothetical protein